MKLPKTAQNASPAGEVPSTKGLTGNEKASQYPRPNPAIMNGAKSRIDLVSRPSKTPFAIPKGPSTANEELPIKKEPKKGSYAEIMARAKANQAKTVAVGTISHKPKEKGALTYKQEVKLRKQNEKDKRSGIVKDKRNNRPGSSDEDPRVGKTAVKSTKKHPTMPAKKPKPQPTYRGTMNPASETSKAKEKAAAQTRRRDNQYAGTDDELDEEDDGNDFDDEDSDDMEAGFLDVEEEETAAAIAARKEDEEEARLEAKLKREKDERKRRMEALAKKAKPPRY